MTQNTINMMINKSFYLRAGALIGTLIPLVFSGMEKTGMISAGVVLGVMIGNDLYQRFDQQELSGVRHE